MSKFKIILVIMLFANVVKGNDSTLTYIFKVDFTKSNYKYGIKDPDGKFVFIKEKNEPSGIREFSYKALIIKGYPEKSLGLSIIRFRKYLFFDSYGYQYLHIQHLNNYRYILLDEIYINREIITFSVRYYSKDFNVIKYD